jgi:general secretion pathway protein L
VTLPRIRVGRETLEDGLVEWARWDTKQARLETGVAELGTPPARGECELVIASELVLLDQLRVPPAQQRRLAGSLRFLAEDAAIPDPESLHVAAAAAPGKDNLAVALIERQWLARLLARLERAGIRAQAAWPECLLAPLPPQAWTVICGARTCYARTGEMEGLVLDRVDGAGAPVALQLALNAARESSRAPARIEIHAGEGAVLTDVASWSATLGLPVEAGPAWHWSQSRERPALDLLQGEFASRTAAGGWRRGLRRSALLAATLVVVVSCGIGLDWAAKARERRALLAEMQSIYRTSFGDNATLVDPPLQMRRALGDLRRQAGEPDAADFLVLLTPLANGLLDAQPLERVTYQRGTLTASLVPRDAAAFGARVQALRGKDTLAAHEMRVQPADASGRLQITVTTRQGQ